MFVHVIPKNDRMDLFRAALDVPARAAVINDDLGTVVQELRDRLAATMTTGGRRNWADGLMDDVDAATGGNADCWYMDLQYYRLKLQATRQARNAGDTTMLPTKHILDWRIDVCNDLWRRIEDATGPDRKAEARTALHAVQVDINAERGTWDSEDG